MNERSKDPAAYYHAKWDEETGREGIGARAHDLPARASCSAATAACSRASCGSTASRRSSPIVGTKKLQPIWVEDVAAYFAAALSSAGGREQTFDLVGAGRRHLGRGVRADPSERSASAGSGFQVPAGLLRPAAAAGRLPAIRGAARRDRDARVRGQRRGHQRRPSRRFGDQADPARRAAPPGHAGGWAAENNRGAVRPPWRR